MSKVSQFRKKCIENDFNYLDGFLRDDSHDLVEYSKVNIFQKLSSFFRRDKRSNIQIVASQMKWCFEKIHNYDFLEHIFSDNIDYSTDDLQILFDSFIDACKSTKLDISNLRCQKYIKRCMPIMNLENFKKAYSYLRDNAFKEMEQHENRYMMKNYISPISDIIWNFQKKDGKDYSQELYDFIGEDKYKFARHLCNRCGFELMTFFSNNSIHNTPKQLHDTYRFLLDVNTIYTKDQRFHSIRDESMLHDTFGYLNSVFHNVSWSQDDYKSFFDLCSNGEEINKLDFPIVFSAINSFKNSKEQNTETKEYIKSFIEKHKKEYVMWLMNDRDESHIFTQLNEQRNREFTDNDIEVCESIIDELIKRQKENNIDLFDVSYIGKGGTSTVYKIGDYVVKIGTRRFVDKIANHRRILQPIIRLKNENAFIEVSDYVENYYFPDKEVKKIYYELLADGYVWQDAKWENLGVLKRQNIPRHGIKRAVKTEDGVKIIDDESSSDEKATNIIGNVDGKPLQRGEVVILDTDCVYELNDPELLKEIISREDKYMDSETREKLNKRLEILEKRAKEDKSEINR